MQINKYKILIQFCLIIGIGLAAAYYLMHQQKSKETAIYSSIHQIEEVEDGDVYQLKLEYKNYRQIPDFIFTHPKLRILELGFNKLVDFDERLLSLVTLEELHLSGGMQSAKSWENIARERSLTKSDTEAIYNQIKFIPEGISQLEMLRILDVRNNKLKNIAKSIGKLEYLEELNLQGNLLEELPDDLGRLSRLRVLDLYSNYLYRLPNCRGLKALEELNVFNNELIALPNSIGNVVNLKTLEAGNNKIEYLPASVQKCKELEFVDLSENKLHDLPAEVVKLEKLHRLNLQHNLIDSLKQYFWRIPALKELQLSYNHIEYLEGDSLANQSLTYLNLSHNQISEIPAKLRFDKLEALVLSHNQFKKLPEFVYDLSELRYLDIGYNQIEHLDLDRLKVMPKLKELIIEANPMSATTTNYIFDELSKLELTF